MATTIDKTGAEERLAFLKKKLRNNPSQEQQAKIHSLMGDAYASAGHFWRARYHFRKAGDYVGVAETYAQQGKYEKAGDAMGYAANRHPNEDDERIRLKERQIQLYDEGYIDSWNKSGAQLDVKILKAQKKEREEKKKKGKLEETAADEPRREYSPRHHHQTPPQYHFNNPFHGIIITAAGIIGGLFFLSSNITGNAIANLSVRTNSILGAGLLIVGLVAGFFWLKSRKR